MLKRKSKLALLLVITMLMTEILPLLTGFSQTSALAEELLTSGVEQITWEEAERELEDDAAAAPAILITRNDSTWRYTISSLKVGYLENMENSIYYHGSNQFTLMKNLEANIVFSGNIYYVFDLNGNVLTGGSKTSVVKVKKNCNVVLRDSNGSGWIKVKSSLIDDEGGAIWNKGTLSLETVDLYGSSNQGGTVTTKNGGAICNKGALQLQKCCIDNFSSKANGGGIWNSGTVTYVGDEHYSIIRDCKASGEGDAIYNAEGGSIIVNSNLGLRNCGAVNAGTISSALPLKDDYAFDGDIKNINNGRIVAGTYKGAITGDGIDTESGNVRIVYTVKTPDDAKKVVYLPPAGYLLSELEKKGIVCFTAEYINKDHQKVKAEDKINPADKGNRELSVVEGYRVTYETNCEISMPSQVIKRGEKLQKPVIKREGYEAYWYKDPELTALFDFSKPLTGNITLYAGWTKPGQSVKVSFDTRSPEITIEPQILTSGEKATQPATPIMEYYKFQYWKKGDTAYDFSLPVLSDMELTAVWTMWYSQYITFHTYGYKTFQITCGYACKVRKPEDPVRKGYVFTGWYTEEKCINLYNFDTRVMNQMDLWAGWKEQTEFTVSFETNGAPAVAAQKVQKGSKAVKPADPVKEGYLFVGWCTDIVCTRLYDFNTPVTEDMKLYACWVEITVTPVKVQFETDGGSSVPTQVVIKGEKAEKPKAPQKKKYIFTGWYTDKGCTKAYDFDTKVNSDLVLYAGWELSPVLPVKVFIDLGDGTEPQVQTVLQYEKATEPAAPVRREYFFTGWYADKACTKHFSFDTPVETETTVYAGWKKKKVCTVTFESGGGSAVENKTVLEMDPVAKPVPDPEKTDHIFICWCTDEACRLSYDFSKPVTGNMKLYARWLQKAVVPVHVRYESNGGSGVPEEVLAQGDCVTKPADPVWELHTFGGWYSDKNLTVKYSFDQKVNEDITLYAKWTLKPVTVVKVTFDYDNGTAPAVETIEPGNRIGRPADPVKSGFIFIGWYQDAACTKLWNFDAQLYEDCTIYAGWDHTPVVPVNVFIDLQDGTEPQVQIVLQHEKATEPSVPVRREYFFTGWYADKSCTKHWSFDTPIETETTVYAGWRKKEVYKVTFESNGGSAVEEKTVLEMDPVAKPVPDPEKTDHIFICWCTDEACRLSYDFSKPVTGNMKLYARWLQKAVVPVHVRYESNGGSGVPEEVLAQGDCAEKPADPVRELHTFGGWYSDKNLTVKYSFDQKVNEDITLYAKWTLKPVTVVKVTFDYGNGTAPAVETIEPGNRIGRPADPAKSGHFFIGWYRDAACTKLWDFDTEIFDDCTIYAGWREKKEFKLTFDTRKEPAEEAFERKVAELDRLKEPTAPVWDGHTFCGWYEDTTWKKLYDFNTPVTEDKKLYARWLNTPLPIVKVTFDSLGGSAVSTQVLVSGDKAEVPEPPVKKPYVFTGWYTDEACRNKFSFDTVIEEDKTLYAGWNLAPAVAVQITFDYGYEGKQSVQTVLQYDQASEPTAPVRREYFFTGWYSDKYCTRYWNFDTPVTENITLTAGWREKEVYTVRFESLGGSTVEAKNVLEEDPVEKPADPVRENYIFIGWCSDALCRKPYDFSRPVTADMTLYAYWLQKSVVPVRVYFESNGGSAVMTQVLVQGDRAEKPEDPVRELFTFAGWYADDQLTVAYDFNEPVGEDTVLYAKWLFNSVTIVHITFDYQDGVTPEKVETVLAGDTVGRPADPDLRRNHLFLGWFADKACTRLWDFGKGVYSDATVYAGWRQKEVYAVSFESMGGSTVSPQAVLEFDKASEPEDPVREGYSFYCWTIDPLGRYRYDFDTAVTEDITLYARWFQGAVIPLDVDFYDVEGGKLLYTQVVASGSNAVKPEKDPVRAGYSFRGWLKDGVEYLFNTPVAEDIQLVGKWLVNHVIPVWLHFDTRGGSSIDPQLVASGSNAVKPDSDPVRNGYHFTGWYQDRSCTEAYDFDTVLKEDRVIYAGWREYSRFTFSFESNGGTPVASQTVTEGEKASAPPNPTREGYTFMFWCEDPEFRQAYDFEKAVTADTVVYARWMSNKLLSVVVHFETGGGSAVADQKINRGQKVTKPVDPTRSCYRFTGWYSDSECKAAFDFDTAVDKDLTLYAGWSYTGGGGGSGGGGGGGGSVRSYDAFDENGKKLGTWKRNDTGWWIEKTDGTWPADTWVYCTWNGVLNWYFFTPEGYMKTGFMTDKDGRTYYLRTENTDRNGSMATGWEQIDGKWYYFNTVSDGHRGAMLTGTVTPDGYKVGRDGVWIP